MVTLEKNEEMKSATNTETPTNNNIETPITNTIDEKMKSEEDRREEHAMALLLECMRYGGAHDSQED